MKNTAPGHLWAYVGTYTDRGGRGVSYGTFDPQSGQLTLTGDVAGIKNPSFLASHPHLPRLYAVSEVGEFEGKPGGAIVDFALDPATGRPSVQDTRPSGGAAPCHLSVDPHGNYVLAASYGGGTVSLLPLEPDGRLGDPADVVTHQGRSIHPTRQQSPHAHSITPDPAGRFALAADLGTDQILIYAPETAQGQWSLHPSGEIAVTPGAGPRLLDFHPNGRWVYVVHELDLTLSIWDYEAARGTLRLQQTVTTLPGDATDADSGAHVRVHPSGKFVYASNRGHDSLAVFAVDDTGRLALRGHVPAGGRNPRHFTIDPSGRFLLVAHQDSNTIATFPIDPDTGLPAPTGQVAQVAAPVCIHLVSPAPAAIA